MVTEAEKEMSIVVIVDGVESESRMEILWYTVESLNGGPWIRYLLEY